ncbi:MAG: hypothetical protein R3335_04640 [Anaerolineales bacterium]|nr:hypothetical protein [Anaerolineales bacterium]
MKQTTRTLLIVSGSVVAGAALLLIGVFIGRLSWGLSGTWPMNMIGGSFVSGSPMRTVSQMNYKMGSGMMGGFSQVELDDLPYPCEFERMSGYGMMGYGMMPYEYTGSGMMGKMGGDMMGSLNSQWLSNIDPIPLLSAQEAVMAYLDELNNADLEAGEVMIFENHAYAQIIESSTGIGAMEVLVDPLSLRVYPEHGPNMMWNSKYSPMAGYGIMGMMSGSGQNFGGMMGGRVGSQPSNGDSGEMQVSPSQAVEAAQEYLDAYLPGTQADDHADPFYGYYTLHILENGNVAGMLSVNGFSGQVFPHTWHGDFIEMSTSDHD